MIGSTNQPGDAVTRSSRYESVGLAKLSAVTAPNKLGSITPTNIPTPSATPICLLLKRIDEMRRV